MPTLADIARRLGVPAPAGAEALAVTGINHLVPATETEISFVGHDRFLPALARSRAAAVLVSQAVHLPPDNTKPALVVPDADLATATVLQMFAPPVPRPDTGVHAAAFVHPSAVVGEGAAVGPNVHVGARARLGARCVLHPGVCVGADTVLGDDCELFPNVVIRERCSLGNRVVIHAGSVVGTDGFGYRWDGKQHAKIPQIGTVVIEDDVEIGSCTCIDRAKFGVTRIGRGTKIDNLVQVAHNCDVGPFCIIAGHAALAGSVTVGAGVVFAGRAAAIDHVSIGDRAVLAAASIVLSDVAAGEVVFGYPARPHKQNLREQAALAYLPDLLRNFRALQKEVAELRKKVES